MKKRRNLLVALLLVVATVVGIGYAELTRVLLVTSEANLRAGEGFDVYFTAGEVLDCDATITSGQNAGSAMAKNEVATVSFSPTTAHYSILGLSQKDDYVTIQYTITNQSNDLDAYLNAVSMTTGEVSVDDGATYDAGLVAEYFEKTVSISVDGASGVTLSQGMDLSTNPVVIPHGKTAVLSITVSLKKTLGASSNGTSSAVPAHVMLRSGSVSLQFKDVAPTNP